MRGAARPRRPPPRSLQSCAAQRRRIRPTPAPTAGTAHSRGDPVGSAAVGLRPGPVTGEHRPLTGRGGGGDRPAVADFGQRGEPEFHLLQAALLGASEPLQLAPRGWTETAVPGRGGTMHQRIRTSESLTSEAALDAQQKGTSLDVCLPAAAARAAGPHADQRAPLTCRPQRRRHDILVSMTRKAPTSAVPTQQPARRRWRLQDAKARLSELVRMAHRDGPQYVTLHGRDAVVVVDADEFNRLKGKRTGELLIEALQAAPHRQVEIEPRRSAMPVRAVRL